mmetsp:Transcript_10049/g.20965  ORF Transcript_10049/g.20965 Transcript_10049/m.20965 type:complete len:267 (-) Transcript_10049:241-1041(-)|eukprot:CAMPEP_0118922850 /NCGR_PEP_ID=MMETSP1169-20130426/1623_1 /TAXON_ID=36882 /ORGANISM="Pyramimonas obovata, Strain CCMP722" /LENGTH=266 /DNA_ID=CAMNT_0006863777 /DNA_START=146 /DNA_END=946 /DNA_ORIENTATION=+
MWRGARTLVSHARQAVHGTKVGHASATCDAPFSVGLLEALKSSTTSFHSAAALDGGKKLTCTSSSHLVSSLHKRELHTTPPLSTKRLTQKEIVRLNSGDLSFLGTDPRGDMPPKPRPDSQTAVPGYGAGGGGAPAFTPTRELTKRKTYFKRCSFMLQNIEYEEALKVAQSRNFPEFRVGDAVEVKLVVPENKNAVETFKGIITKRQNRGLGSSFAMLNYIHGTRLERQFPLYNPNLKEMTILERRKVRRGKLNYLYERTPSEFTIK